MKIGFIGLGKLGLPCALAIERFGGHAVCGYDISPDIKSYLHQGEVPYKEEGMRELLATTRLQLLESIGEVVSASDLIFVAVQTPHETRFEGIQRTPTDRSDFEYGFLVQAIRNISLEVEKQDRSIVLAIISTVLPGTIEREIGPLIGPGVHLAYNPSFIAMGTTIQDFLHPEFALVGTHDPRAADTLSTFYESLHDREVVVTSIESAELIKMAYNTFIGMKIVFANTLMEICHKTSADVDAVTRTLGMASERLISSRYMSGGMGDGGGCHPRDQIAMSFLAKKLDLSHDFFGALMEARDAQAEWLATLVQHWHAVTDLPIVVLGKAYKPETNLTIGSPSFLVQEFLAKYGQRVEAFDPFVDDGEVPLFNGPRVYLVATKHAEFSEYHYPHGSIVIDPWGYIADREGVTTIRVGRHT